MKRIVVFFGCFLMGATLVFAQHKPIITFEKTLHDFGEVLEANGDISYEFVVKNTGNAPLVVNNATASCGCTKPVWTKEPIEAGKTGVVKATYQVKGRPGPFSKTISVYSNAGDKPFVLTIKGNVKSAPVDPTVAYPIAVGDLLLKNDVQNLGNVRNSEVRSTSIEIFNKGTVAITPVFNNKVPYITLKSEPATIAPNSKGIIIISVDGKTAKTFGTVENKFVVGYSGNFGNKYITIAATFVEDFQKMDSEAKAKAPVMKLEQSNIDFGSVSAKNFKKTQSLKIANSGKSTLKILSIKPSADWFSVTKGKKEIKPGETADFQVTCTGKITGRVNNAIEIVTNDPDRGVYRVSVMASN